MKVDKLFIYSDQEQTNADGVKEYRLGTSNRDAGNRKEIDLAKEDPLLEFEFGEGENKTTWICDAATLHELYPEMDEALKQPGDRGGAGGEQELPAFISAPGSDRGLLGDIAVKVLKVFAKKGVADGIEKIAVRLEDKNLVHGIPDNNPMWKDGYRDKFIEDGAAIFRIDKNFDFSLFDGKPSGNPFFLFIHGTNSNAMGAFCELMDTPAWSAIHNNYGNNVIAFQHRTLTESPLENAIKLVNALPHNATLHIISHSRGGIVGDILCKYSTNGTGEAVGFSDENIELLKKEGCRDKDIANIKELNRIFKTKKISVTRFLRVACPAAGTKLASRRLDHFLNALFNLFGGTANPFVDILKELLSAAVETKDNIDVLPGLEAQNPASPFIKILNDQSEQMGVDGSSLVVMSGNGTVSFSGNGLLVILCKLFYWQRNDLVVNTDSMYLGARRRSNIQYFFDQGPEVNHVRYFKNPKTREALLLAINTPAGSPIPGFKSILQTEVPGTDRDERGLDHGELYPFEGVPTGKRPVVVLLPGIMGSNLEKNEQKLWLNYIRAVFGGLSKLEYAEDNSIKATSLIKTSYKKLATRLSNNYDVLIYPFDWRRQLNDCARDFDATIKRLLQLGQPIKIIGHSMGGVLVRDFIINHKDTWQQLNGSKGFRLLFLGSPLGGSFRIPAVLFGQDSIINSLATLDQFHTKKELLEMFCQFPGILSLLPLNTEPANDFASMTTWINMRSAAGDNSWPLPDQKILNQFREYRDKIIAGRDQIDFTNIVYIAGKDKQTPCGYFNDTIPPRTELVFLYTTEGDQSVTWESGIPQQVIQRDSVYYVNVTHGGLANAPEIFDGIEEILEKGATGLLSKKRPVTRSAEQKVFRSTPDTNFDFSETGLFNAIMGVDDKQEPISSQVPVTVTVSNGDLTYATYPLLAGHFINDGILYAERVIDENLKGMLTNKHELGLYPGEIGTNQLFTGGEIKNFAGAIIIGLGEPGGLTQSELAKSVAQGVANYLLSIRDQLPSDAKVGISALLIACGYGGLSVESSLKAIIEGVNAANSKITGLFKNKCRIVQHIEFIEMYLDKAINCMYALTRIASRENFSYNISIGSTRIRSLLGLKKRLPLDSAEDWWNRITVRYKAGATEKDPASLLFGASTGAAREEERELYTSTPLINLFVADISQKNQWSAATAKTLFELMIPNEFKEKLKRKGNITWVLDDKTAEYPWELLQDTTTANALPLCINAGMIRQLAISDYRIDIKGVAKEKALIVADPPLGGMINQLPGAQDEGRVVEEILNNNGYPVTPLIGNDATDIVRNLFSDEYTILHLAGHGVVNANSPKKSGMAIGKDIFLTVFDIEQMTAVPELVFVNCCHLGKADARNEAFYRERYKLAANIGTELIRIGAKAVIAAGWAVNDDAANDFARQFYGFMFAGDNFGDAIKKARKYVYEHHRQNNTWGAYQCYGDPFYRLKRAASRKSGWTPNFLVADEADIALENLLNELQMGKNVSNNLDSLNAITKAVDKAGLRNAPITEKEALIYFELGLYDKSLAKFEALLKYESAGFSFSSMEKYCNARAKYYLSNYFLKGDGKKAGALAEALEGMNAVVSDIEVLLRAGKTAERYNILASTYKRIAMLEQNEAARDEAFKMALYYYTKATGVTENENRTYSLTNAIEIESILVLADKVKRGGSFVCKGETVVVRSIESARKQLEKTKRLVEQSRNASNLNFWDLGSIVNIDLCLLLINENPSGSDAPWQQLKSSHTALWQIAGSPGKKIAELEHIQFLIFAIAAAKGIKTGTDYRHYDIFNDNNAETLTVLTNQLRSVCDGRHTPSPKAGAAKKVAKKAVKKAAVKKKAK